MSIIVNPPAAEVERIPMARVYALILTEVRRGLPAPYAIRQNGPGSTILCLNWASAAEMGLWDDYLGLTPDRGYEQDGEWITWAGGKWNGWSIQAYTRDPLPGTPALDTETAALIDEATATDPQITQPLAPATCDDCGGEMTHRAGCPSEPEHLADHYAADPARCPSCDSPSPRLHPSTAPEGGEVYTICPDPFHAHTDADDWHAPCMVVKGCLSPQADNAVRGGCAEHDGCQDGCEFPDPAACADYYARTGIGCDKPNGTPAERDRIAILDALTDGPSVLSDHPHEAVQAALRDGVIRAWGPSATGRTVYALAQIPIVVLDVTPNPAPSPDIDFTVDALAANPGEPIPYTPINPDAREYVPVDALGTEAVLWLDEPTQELPHRGNHVVPTGLPLLVQGHEPVAPHDHAVPIVEVTAVVAGPLVERDDNAVMAGVLPVRVPGATIVHFSPQGVLATNWVCGVDAYAGTTGASDPNCVTCPDCLATLPQTPFAQASERLADVDVARIGVPIDLTAGAS